MITTKRSVGVPGAVALLVATTIGAAGQTSPPPAATTGSDGDVAIVGCLMRTDTSANRPGSSYSSTNGVREDPAVAVGGAGSGFVLKDAAIQRTASPSASSEKASETHRAGLQEFRVIEAGGKLDLRAHVNTQVEVRGRLVPAGDGAHPGPRLNIGANAVSATEIRTVAKACPADL
jgi:hypothetical protein